MKIKMKILKLEHERITVFCCCCCCCLLLLLLLFFFFFFVLCFMHLRKMHTVLLKTEN